MDEARASTSAAVISLSLPSSASVQPEATVTSSRSRKSLVWEYFEYDPATSESVCQVLSTASDTSSTIDICGQYIAGKFPTNLQQHLRRVHPSEFSELSAKDDKEKQEKEKQQSAQRAASRKVSHQLTLAESLKSRSAYKKRVIATDKSRGSWPFTLEVPT